MKHIKAILYAALLCAALALAGCSDILAPPDGAPGGAKEKKGGLRISVSSDAANPRTLFPELNFTKYVLSFSGPASHAAITLNNETTTTVDDLAVGLWTVTAVGYVTINGTDYEAAQGEGNVNVSGTSFQSLDIVLRAITTGTADGFFSYSVSFPPSKVKSAELRIYPYDSNEWDWRAVQCNLVNDPSKTIPLAPGYYMMNIRLRNDYQTAGHTEVVYICPNMETAADYVFTDADFTETITLSGTIDVKVNGQTPSGNVDVYLYAYIDENYNYSLASTWVDLDDNNTWSITTAAFDAETPLYFRVGTSYSGAWFNRSLGEGVKAHDQDKTGINLGTVNFSAITLSGTINVTCDGNPVSRVLIEAVTQWGSYGNPTWLNSPGANEAWSITIPAFDTPTDITFRVRGNSLNGMDIFNINVENLANGVLNQDKMGIVLNLGDYPDPFNAARPLAPDKWEDGNITDSGAADWYSVNVTADTVYCLWWKDLTLDIWCYIYDGSGYIRNDFPVYRDSQDKEQSFYSPYSGTFYIRCVAINGGSTGTYQIVYNTTGIRP
jgi:hypothetical protein